MDPKVPRAVRDLAEGQTVLPWSGASVDGLQFYMLAPQGPGAIRGVAVDADGEALTGTAGFDAAAAHHPDAKGLAALAILFLEGMNSSPLVDPADAKGAPAAQAAAVKPPSLEGNVLDYWRWHGKINAVVQIEVDVSTHAIRYPPPPQ